MDKDVIETKDISLSSYLYATKQVKLVGKRKLPNGETYFQFSPKQKAEELIQQYWNDQAPSLQPRSIFSALRDIKDMIFGG